MNKKPKSWTDFLIDMLFIFAMTAAISLIFGFFSGYGAYFAGTTIGYIKF